MGCGGPGLYSGSDAGGDLFGAFAEKEHGVDDTFACRTNGSRGSGVGRDLEFVASGSGGDVFLDALAARDAAGGDRDKRNKIEAQRINTNDKCQINTNFQ